MPRAQVDFCSRVQQLVSGKTSGDTFHQNLFELYEAVKADGGNTRGSRTPIEKRPSLIETSVPAVEQRVRRAVSISLGTTDGTASAPASPAPPGSDQVDEQGEESATSDDELLETLSSLGDAASATGSWGSTHALEHALAKLSDRQRTFLNMLVFDAWRDLIASPTGTMLQTMLAGERLNDHHESL